MKQIVGLLLIIAGAVLGLYVGGYLCFIGGIIQLIQSVTPVIKAVGIAWGLGKIVFASGLGSLSFLGLATPGIVMLQD